MTGLLRTVVTVQRCSASCSAEPQDRKVAPQPKQGIFKRIFGRSKRGGEHESFSSFAQYAPPERMPNDAAPNIVILNSLTHDQLMELLKVSGSIKLPVEVAVFHMSNCIYTHVHNVIYIHMYLPKLHMSPLLQSKEKFAVIKC